MSTLKDREGIRVKNFKKSQMTEYIDIALSNLVFY